MKNIVVFLHILAVLLVALLFVGCAEKNVSQVPDEEISPVSCVIVLPTRVPFEHAGGKTKEAEDLRTGALFLQSVIEKELRRSSVIRVIDPLQLRNQKYSLSGGTFPILREIGIQENCEAVLLSNLTRFKKRQGGEYAVDEPASAAFDLKLVETKTAKTLWTSSFNETQESLMSNLFSFNKARKRGFKWITAKELVARGARERLQNCPYFYK